MAGGKHKHSHDHSHDRTDRPIPDPVRHDSEPVDLNRRLSDEGPHAPGETEEQHAAHSQIPTKRTWGLNESQESALFYFWMATSLCCLIAAAGLGAYYHAWGKPFIGTMSAFMVLHWAGWLQTASGMAQRASWVRDEGDLATRRQYLYLAVRLNRLMLPTAIVGLVTFIQAYARRFDLNDLAYWLLFLLVFIWNIVFCVMNAYNNISWESSRLEYEDPDHPYNIGRLAILGLGSPTKKEHGNGKEREGKEV
ncbi:hypothetical protein LTR53_016377 [Teratosphaeriaceae sp. CCFEE 6253]|nr:hypothetical protein LTR53_016377 [Teratosphaeriaceae sp. CCFEE 6253]